MTRLNFRTRSPQRDDATDAGRFDRLARLLTELSGEVAAEKSGLERRYQEATTNAAFLVEAIENDGSTARSQGRADDLTSVILNCERRLETLSRQAAALDEFRRTLGELVKTSSR